MWSTLTFVQFMIAVVLLMIASGMFWACRSILQNPSRFVAYGFDNCPFAAAIGGAACAVFSLVTLTTIGTAPDILQGWFVALFFVSFAATVVFYYSPSGGVTPSPWERRAEIDFCRLFGLLLTLSLVGMFLCQTPAPFLI